MGNISLNKVNFDELSDKDLLEYILKIASGKEKGAEYMQKINERYTDIFRFFESDIQSRIAITDKRMAILGGLIPILAQKDIEKRFIARGELENAIKIIMIRLYAKSVEEVLVLFYKGKKHIPIVKSISVGTNNQSVFPLEIIIETALMYGSDRIIVGHNHPYSYAIPSFEDISITKKLYTMAANVSIELVDHIIVESNKICTFSNGKGMKDLSIGEDIFLREYCQNTASMTTVKHIKRRDAIMLLNRGISPWED